jgi:hypothetical protein
VKISYKYWIKTFKTRMMKKKLFKLTGVLIIILFSLNGCKKDTTTPNSNAKLVSPGNEIVFFKIVNPAATGIIDTTARTISISLPGGTNVTSLATDISLAAGHTMSPAPGVAQNFTNPVVYTVTRPNKTTTQWTVTVTASSGVNVTQDISQSVTWTSDKIYTINSAITVNNNAVLTIQPGTVVRFGAGGSLSIGYSTNGTLIANGTSASPIVFTSSAVAPTAGSWDGIYFYDKASSNSSVTYCNIMYAGSNSSYGALNIISCDLAVNNCNISFSGSYGIYTSYGNNKGGFISFANNIINTTAKYGLVIDAHKLGTIGTGNTFTNILGISLIGSYNSTTAQTWKNLNAPYIVSQELDIDGNLTIEAGTRFRFDGPGWLAIGYSNATTFVADGGTSATPITFTSNAASPVAGSWRGIVFYGFTQTNTKMNYCIVDYAGSNATYGAVDLNGSSSITFTNNTIRNSGGFGINLETNAGFQAFTNNTILSCADHLVYISTKHLPDLGSPNVLTPTAGKGIDIYGSVQYSSAVTWKKQTADFYVTGGEVDIDGFVTIEAGSNFLFSSDSYFWFGYYATTKITAIGTSTNKITFTSSALMPAAGSWKGLIFDSFIQPTSELGYCQFQYTGLSVKPAIYTRVSFPVGNTTISNFSSTNAAEYQNGLIVPPGTGNNFTWVAN